MKKKQMIHVRKICFSFAILGSIFANIACKNTTEDKSDFYDFTENVFVTIPTNQLLADGSPSTKTILLNGLSVTQSFRQEKNAILQISETASVGEKDYRNGIIPFNQSPGAVDLGMNHVPVLDQGAYGTCVTFSTTALLDALLSNTDAISQQCVLSLSKSLGNDYWNGAQNALQILRPFRTYGIVEHDKCASKYPDSTLKINLNDYKTSASSNIDATGVTGNFIEPITLNMVRAALNKKHRIVLGFGIKKETSANAVGGFNIQINNKQMMGGLWACKQPGSSLNYCGIPSSGHAVVVIGYDDAQQLLKIRNSWGKYVGDHGDYYMSYRFFELMSFNGTEMY